MTGDARDSPALADARLAAILFAIDPIGLGGAVVRGGPGSLRDQWTELVRALLPPSTPVRRIPLHIQDDRLLGGLDLTASLAAGRPVAQRGVLAEADRGVVVLAMAERIEAATAARLTAALDAGEISLERDGLTLRQPARFGVIALDEGLTPDEQLSGALRERLAFHLDLSDWSGRDALDPESSLRQTRLSVQAARRGLGAVSPADDNMIAALCAVSQRLGVGSARAPLMALRAARAHAALQGRTAIAAVDTALAARLVLGPRALADGDPTPSPATQARDETHSDPPTDRGDTPSDPEEPAAADGMQTVVAAIDAALPDDLLERAVAGPTRAPPGRAGGAGGTAKSTARGRPAGWRSGALRAGDRLNLIETLRAAAPWQALRNRSSATSSLQIRASDFRVRRFVQRPESTTIFVVDASGSTALQRLAEAKGAVELLLAKAYVSRSHVALIAFRGAAAETLLAPTRSLTRARNCLADLPGGGGTPLASAIDAAVSLACAEAARNRLPRLVFLTDGAANIAGDGSPGRAAAARDAAASAQQLAAAGIAAVVVDTSRRPSSEAASLAEGMRAAYAPLPYLDAAAVADLVNQQPAGMTSQPVRGRPR